MPQLKSVWSFTGKVLNEQAKEPPKFDEIVKVVIATFAVFTGVAIKDYVTSSLLGDLHWFAFTVLVCLLLRYIIGSAVHLTYTYVQKDPGQTAPNSSSVLLLVKDFGFVVYFGVVAVHMAKSADFAAFWFAAKCFLTAGLVWSISDCLIRYVWCKAAGNDREWPKRQFWLAWAMIDAAQLLLTWLIPLFWPAPEVHAPALAAFYALFLLIDIKVIVRIMQVTPAP